MESLHERHAFLFKLDHIWSDSGPTDIWIVPEDIWIVAKDIWIVSEDISIVSEHFWRSPERSREKCLDVGAVSSVNF